MMSFANSFMLAVVTVFLASSALPLRSGTIRPASALWSRAMKRNQARRGAGAAGSPEPASAARARPARAINRT